MADEPTLKVKNESDKDLVFVRDHEKIKIGKGKQDALPKNVLLGAEFQSALGSGHVSFVATKSKEEFALGREVLRQLIHPAATQYISAARNLEGAKATLAQKGSEYNAAWRHANETVKAAKAMAQGAEYLANAVDLFLSTAEPEKVAKELEADLKQLNETLTKADKAPSEAQLEAYVEKRKALEAQLREARRIRDNAERAMEAELGPLRRSLLEAAGALKDADKKDIGKEI